MAFTTWVLTLPTTSFQGYRYLKCESTLFRQPSPCGAALTPWVFPWRYPLPAQCGSGVGFHRARLPSPTQTRGGRAARSLVHELSEVTGGVEVAVQHQRALVAAECPFGQAQCGFHHATGRTGRGGRVPAVREVHGAAGPPGFVLDLASEFAPADTGDVAGEAPVAEHPGDA